MLKSIVVCVFLGAAASEAKELKATYRETALDAEGIKLLAQERYKEAAEKFDQSLRLNPKNARAYANRCTARYRLQDFDGAIADFTRAVSLSPKLKGTLAPSVSDAYYRRALRKVDQGLSSTAAEDLYAAVKLDRKNALAYVELGYLSLQAKQYETAVPYFDRAIRISPKLAEAYANRAAALAALGKNAAAASDARRAVELNPRLGEGLGAILKSGD